MPDLDPALVEKTLAGRCDAEEASVLADHFLENERSDLAASALDIAFGQRPHDDELKRQRAGILESLCIEEHGIAFRYIPAGTFLMGSERGERDERPVHAVRLPGFWLSETPVTWATYCDLMEWSPPPASIPKEDEKPVLDRPYFYLYEENKIRMQYCETQTTGASDWHAHAQDLTFTDGEGNQHTAEQLFGRVPRADESRPFEYDIKPMVAISWMDAEDLCRTLSTDEVAYRLPTEAQWEKGARGGLIQKPYSWGDEPPTAATCDFDHFGRFAIQPPRTLPPNPYGLYGMCGGVWEWTSEPYDALAYQPHAPAPPEQHENQRVLRGGSWADCGDAVTVSFRMSLEASSWRHGVWSRHQSPTVGFRLCRMRV